MSWHLDDRCALTDIRAVLGSYAAYHGLSLRTAWTDWGRLVAAGWLAPTCSPANQGRGGIRRAQGRAGRPATCSPPPSG